MRKLFIIIAVFCSFAAGAQVLPGYQNDPAHGRSIDRYEVRKDLRIDYLKNNEIGDSVLTTDKDGKVILKIGSTAVTQDGRISGAEVTWTGDSTAFFIPAGTFRKFGELYFTNDTVIILDKPNDLYGRIDLIVFDTTNGGQIRKVTGELSPTPIEPSLADYQIKLTTGIAFSAGATTPSNVSVSLIYDENTEWTAGHTGTMTVNFNNTSTVYHGSKSAFISSYSKNSALTFGGTPVDVTSDGVLSLWINLTGSFSKSFTFQLWNNTTAASNPISVSNTYGFNPNYIGWQNIAIPQSAFSWTSQTYNKATITITGNGSFSGLPAFYLDYMQVQKGLTNVTPPTDYSGKLDAVKVTKTTDANDTIHKVIEVAKGIETQVGEIRTPQPITLDAVGDAHIDSVSPRHYQIRVNKDVSTTRINPNSVTAINAPTYLTTPTYDGSGQAVHPDVYYNPNGKYGFKWWMVYEPYPNANDVYEKVSLMCSNDGITWITPPNVVNPIEPLAGLNPGAFAPDGDIIEGLDGKLYIFYNAHTDNVGGSAIFVRSYDGATVSAATKLFDNTLTYGIVSPAITIENGIYVMRAVNIYTSPNAFIKQTASVPTGPWVAQQNDTVLNMPAGLQLWHLDVHKMGDELHAFIVLETLDADYGASQGLYFASSQDGHSWTIAQKPFLKKSSSVGQWDANLIYRASAVEVNTPVTKYKLFYSARDTAQRWHIGTTYVNLGDTILDSKANSNSVVNLTDTQTVSGLKTFTNRIIISRAVQSAVLLNTTSAGKNWAIVNSDQAYGDLAFRQSVASNGDPLTGTIRLYFGINGAFGLGTTDTQIGDGSYASYAVMQSAGTFGALIALRKPDLSSFFQGIYFQDKNLNSGWVFGVDASGNAIINHGTGANETSAITDARNNSIIAFAINPTTKAMTVQALTATQYKLSGLNTAPATATDTGTFGEIRVTAGYIYVCIATNTWVRSALTTW